MARLAQQAFEAGNHVEALYWGLRGGEDSDWAHVRTAACVSALLGAAEAAAYLHDHDGEARGANYRYAVLSFLMESGQWEAALGAAPRAAAMPELVEPWYLLNELRLLLRRDRVDEAMTLLPTRAVLLDEPVTAWPLIEALLRQGKDREDCAEYVARGLHALGDVEGGPSLLVAEYQARTGRNVIRRPLPAAAVDWQREAEAAYLRWPLDRALGLATQMEERCLSLDQVESRLTDAVRSRAGFCVNRVGDGEGRLLADLEELPLLAAETRAVADRVWFWNSGAGAFDFLRDRLPDALRMSDIVGFNPAYRVELEYFNSLLGYVGVVAGNETLRAWMPSGPLIARNYLAVQLDATGGLQRIGKEAGSVTVVGPHTTPPTPMQVGCGVSRMMRIPSEGHPLVQGDSLQRAHFPDVCDEVMRELAQGAGGPLVLVAGGGLGKLYTTQARLAGTVAIDIGSVVDQWAGFRTR